MREALFVFLGGGVGSVLRFGISGYFNGQFPYGTFTVNLLGSLLIGLVLGFFEKQIFTNVHVLALAVGFCGGFTTFSSFAAENLKMLQNGQYLQFFFYVLLSLLLGITMVFLGFKMAK